MDKREKAVRLRRHLEKIQNQANGPIPERHKFREQAYKEWLALEIKRTESKIQKIS